MNIEEEILNSQPVKPAHYQLTLQDGTNIEAKDVINAFLKKLVIEHPVEAETLMYEWGNILKYVLRAPFKGSKFSDLKKAHYCLSLLIREEENTKKEVADLMKQINEMNSEKKREPEQLNLFIDDDKEKSLVALNLEEHEIDRRHLNERFPPRTPEQQEALRTQVFF